MKVLHIAPHEGKFFRQLDKSMATLEDVDSRFVLYPKWLEPSQTLPLPPEVSTPETTRQFNSVVHENSDWADIVIIHGLTRKAGLAIARLPDRILKSTRIIWSIWGFERSECDPKAQATHYLPLTAAEVENFRRSGTWKQVEKAGNTQQRRQHWSHGISTNLKAVKGRFSDFRSSRKHIPPEWLQDVASKIDMYCALEPKADFAAKLTGLRAVHNDGFPYYSLQDVLDEPNQAVHPANHILVGGRSDPTGNHLDAIALLTGRISDQQKVYLPLNYGDRAYGDMVASHAERTLGRAAHPLWEWMSLEDYSQLLSKTGIVFMNQVRGQSLGTEILTIAKGAKLFLRSENLHARHFRNLGLSVASIDRQEDLSKLSDPLTRDQIAKNREILRHNWSDNAVSNRISAILQRAMEL